MSEIALTVDGKPVTVPAGSTILQAARAAGVAVPTLCHRDDLEPWTSCFMCVVQVDGRADLTPACAAPAVDGMQVTAGSPAVREARKAALELLLSDHRGDCVAPCSRACPAGLDIPGFIGHQLRGDDRAAIALIKQRIPLPGTLGRVCARYCERACRRKESDEPIAICALKRAAADLDALEPYVPETAPPTGKRVAVVGAGPAGLSAAFYLAQLGHSCTVMDANPEPGGMLRYGIPEFRLPRQALAAEVDVIRRMGVRFRQGCAVGSAVSLDELRRGHDAVLLAMGAQAGAAVELPGSQMCLSAMSFLARVAAGERPYLPHAVAVLGCGNEAVDAARTAVRLGASDVSLILPASCGSIRCADEYVEAAVEEGVRFLPSVHVSEVRPSGIDFLDLVCTRDGEETKVRASWIICAAERRVDTSLLWSMRVGTREEGVVADKRTHETDVPDVFAAGDVVTGPRTVVHAVASGRSAARSIDQRLRGDPISPEPRPFNVPIGELSDADRAELLRGIGKAPRVAQQVVPVGQRTRGFDEIAPGLSPQEARDEAARCLQCDCAARDDCRLRQYAVEYGAQAGHFRGDLRPLVRDTSGGEVVFEPAKCILCGLCVRIAREQGEELGIGFRQRGFETRVSVPFGGPVGEGLRNSARACAQACPTGALFLRPAAGSGG